MVKHKANSGTAHDGERDSILPLVYSGGLLDSTTGQSVKIYNVSGYDQSVLPAWMLEKYQKGLKKDTLYRKRIQLIQDFDFPEASSCIRITPDERFIVATGTYKPQIRVYDLDQLCMKFERHTDAETVKFCMLDQDWSKFVLLQADRTLEFHTQGGVHYKTRIPKFGRDILYDPVSCDTMTVGDSFEVYRLNLEQGKFLKSWETKLSEINVIKTSTCHRLYSLGGSSSRIELWDPRSRACIGGIVIHDSERNTSPGHVTSLHFLPDGITLAAGTEQGSVYVYDLRRRSDAISGSAHDPLQVKDHHYRYPIHSLDYDPKQRLIFSVDQKIVKLWNINTGDTIANVESTFKINDFCWQRRTGLFLMAVEDKMMQGYYMPALGPAPTWCQHLEHLTEELEQKSDSVLYDNYKFVTKSDLEQLGLSHLIGSKVICAYMHGFFIDQRLYEKAKAIANPFAYEQYRQEQIRNKILKDQETRIHADPSALIRANKSLAKIWKDKGIEVDHRFSKDLFTNPDFELENLNPSGKKTTVQHTSSNYDSDGTDL
jgi:ribosome biogenesis protein ENP2